MNSFILAVSTMVGTIVGAGIFGIPYVIARSGAVPGVFYFVVLGGIVTLLHLFYGEICLRTTEKHRIVGYAYKYLGVWGRVLASLALVFIIGGTLLAYLILAGEFLKIVSAPFLSLSPSVFSLLFLIVCAFFISQGRQLITKVELFLTLALVGVVALVLAIALPQFQVSNLSFFDLKNVFLPYGVILFTLIGFEAIPEVATFLRDKKSTVRLDTVILAATSFAAALSFIFAFSVVGISGAATSSDAFSGLVPFVGSGIITLGAFFGVLSIASSFLVLGNYLKNSLRHDFGVPTGLAIVLTALIPLIPFLLGIREFIGVIGIVGVFVGMVEGLLMIRIFHRAKTMGDRVPEYQIRVPTMLLFLLGAILVGGAVAELLF
jgi:tyrosine-specific transport protein